MVSELVRSVSASELAFIAGRDYGQDADRHLAALNAVCLEQGGIIGTDQYWFPYEVIELGAHTLAPGHEREFAICTLLVLANVSAGVDTSTDIQAKFADRAADYDSLPVTLREEILHAYQTAEG
jgi:hypothetical protein